VGSAQGQRDHGPGDKRGGQQDGNRFAVWHLIPPLDDEGLIRPK